MKHILLLIPLMLASCAFAQTNLDEHEWQATVKVADELGAPIANANVRVGYFTNNDTTALQGLTDTNGIFIATHTTPTRNYIEYGLTVVAGKDGYYGTRLDRELGIPYDAVKWNPTINLLLKKVGKPIAMYAKRLNIHVPDLDKPVGFDLELGDWVGPYGKGIKADIDFTGHFDKFADGESDFTLTVSFPKDGDGLQEFVVPESEKGSGLRSSHEAPIDGYQAQWVQTDKRKPGKSIESNYDANRSYYFRVRTAKNSEGKIVSAHYGKIYGDFMKLTYYLNPTPNDRNIEFDPKQNLLQGTDDSLRVSAP